MRKLTLLVCAATLANLPLLMAVLPRGWQVSFIGCDWASPAQQHLTSVGRQPSIGSARLIDPTGQSAAPISGAPF
jgi:hypothetical protein